MLHSRLTASILIASTAAIGWTQDKTPKTKPDNTSLLNANFWTQFGIWLVLALLLGYALAWLVFRGSIENRHPIKAGRLGFFLGILVAVVTLPTGLYFTNSEFKKLLTQDKKEAKPAAEKPTDDGATNPTTTTGKAPTTTTGTTTGEGEF
jgi:hypothetical protein